MVILVLVFLTFYKISLISIPSFVLYCDGNRKSSVTFSLLSDTNFINKNKSTLREKTDFQKRGNSPNGENTSKKGKTYFDNNRHP